MLSHLDEILLQFGNPGRFQVFIAFLLCCIQIPVIFPKILLTYYASAPPHRCLVKPNSTLDLSDLLPMSNKNGKIHFASCEAFVNPKDHGQGTHSCADGWEYLISDKEWTIVSEWDLVCKKEYLVNLLPYLLSGSSMIGSLLFGSLSDHFGRKLILFIAVLGNTAASVTLHFSPNYMTFAVLYSVMGIFTAGVHCVSFVLLMETLATPYHLKYCVILSVFWTLGELVLILLTWPVHHWRFLQLTVSVPGLICIAYFWLLPSSLLWQLVHHKTAAAENELERLANYNGVSLPPNFRLKLKEFYNGIKTTGAVSGSGVNFNAVCFYHRLHRSSFILFYLWFVMWFTLNIKVPNLMLFKEHQHMGPLVTGLGSLGMILLIYFVVNRLGPKPVQASLLLVGGLLCVSSSVLEVHVIPLFKPSHDYYILILMSRVAAVLGKEVVRLAIPCLFFHAAKRFPTLVRASGIGVCLLWARSAEIVAPHVSFMVGENSWYLATSASGILSILGGFLTFALPACWHQPLPAGFDVQQDSHNKSTSGIHGHNITTKCKWPYSDKELICNDSDSGTSAKLPLRKSESLGGNSLDIDFSVEGDAFLACLEHPNSFASKTTASVVQNGRYDSESRLTDLEDELAKVWELNRTKGSVSFATKQGLVANRGLQYFTQPRRNMGFEEDETAL